MSQEIFPDIGGKGWPLDWTNSPLRILVEVTHKAFWFYMKSVPLYTGRRLSKSGDILAAFEGVSWLLEQHLNALLLYELPTSHFDLAPPWMPLGVLSCRRARNPNQSQYSEDYRFNLETSNNLDDDDFGAKELPRWSLYGWVNGKMEYTAEMIDSCSQNAHEWLEHHTWIQWHIRDYKGHLRPLWNRKKRYEDLSSDIRWKGYAGLPKLPPPGGDLAASKPRSSGGEESTRKESGKSKPTMNRRVVCLRTMRQLPRTHIMEAKQIVDRVRDSTESQTPHTSPHFPRTTTLSIPMPSLMPLQRLCLAGHHEGKMRGTLNQGLASQDHGQRQRKSTTN